MKYLLVLLILCNTAQLATASSRHEFAGGSRLHASAVLSPRQDTRLNVNYSESLNGQRDGQGLIPIANQNLRGLLFVLGGLAGPGGILVRDAVAQELWSCRFRRTISTDIDRESVSISVIETSRHRNPQLPLDDAMAGARRISRPRAPAGRRPECAFKSFMDVNDRGFLPWCIGDFSRRPSPV